VAAVEGHLAGAADVLDTILRRAAAGSRPGEREDPHRVALVIEGGVARGAVSGGMALAIHEAGLTTAFDHVYGSSAGAINGAWLTSSTPEKLVGWTDPAYTRMLVRAHAPLRRRPVVDVRTLAEIVYVHLAPMDFASIVASPVAWHPLATDAETGEAVDLQPFINEPADVQLAIRASAAIPLLAGPPVEMGGRILFDAGVAEPIPFPTAIAQGATHLLVLRSRRPNDPPRASRATAALARTAMRGYGPEFRRALGSSSQRYVAADRLLNGHGPLPHPYPPVAVVRPPSSALTVGRYSTDPRALEAAFEAGRTALQHLVTAHRGSTRR
jgi:predicted patatin/cPLA2 family phospholipase